VDQGVAWLRLIFPGRFDVYVCFRDRPRMHSVEVLSWSGAKAEVTVIVVTLAKGKKLLSPRRHARLAGACGTPCCCSRPMSRENLVRVGNCEHYKLLLMGTVVKGLTSLDGVQM